MNRDHLIRIAWKDHRRMRVLWYGMAGLWCFFLVYMTSRDLMQGRIGFSIASIEVMSLLIPFFAIIYGLAWAAVTFSTEHEDGTYQFLRSLPVDAKHVFFGKFLYGVCSTFLMAVALLVPCLIARGLLTSRGISPDPNTFMPAGLAGFSIFLIALIPVTLTAGVFWSLKLKRPLISLVATATSLLAAPAVPVFCDVMQRKFSSRIKPQMTTTEIVMTSVILLVVAVVFYVIDRRMVGKWLPNSSLSPTNPFVSSSKAPTETRQRTPLGRLFWLQARQEGWGTVGAIVIATLLFGFVSVGNVSINPNVTHLFFVPLPMLFLAGFIGVLVFRSEHRHQRYRLLSQLGVSPTTYWLTRMAIPFCFALAIAGFTLWNAPLQILGVAVGVLSAFAIGALASLASPSTVVACAVTLACLLASWYWITLCMVSTIPLWLGALPTVVLPLFAGYLRAPRWFQQNHSWKQWVVPLLPIVALVGIVPLASACYRIFTVPSVELPAVFQELDTRIPETDGSRAYRQLFAALPNQGPVMTAADGTIEIQAPAFRQWVVEHPKFVDQLLAAIDMGGPIPEEYRSQDSLMLPSGKDAMLLGAACLILSGNDALEAGNVEHAWDRYRATLTFSRHLNDGKAGSTQVTTARQIEQSVYGQLVPWAMANENTPDRIEQAAAYIDNFRKQLPKQENALAVDYQELQEVWDDPHEFSRYHAGVQSWAKMLKSIPWERIRSNRMIGYRYALAYEHSKNPLARIEYPDAMTTLFNDVHPAPFAHSLNHNEHVRRGVICQLAAIAFGRQHGKYPTDLSELRIDGQELPKDLYSPGKYLRLVTQSTTGELYPAPCIYSYSPERDYAMYSPTDEGWGRLFLLPSLDDWNLQNFNKRRQPGTPPLAASVTEPHTFGLANSVNGYYEDETHLLVDVLNAVNQERLNSTLIRSVHDIFDSGSTKTKRTLTDYLTGHSPSKELADEMIPVLVEALDGDDIATAVIAAELLQSWIEFDSQVIVNYGLTDRVSRASHRETDAIPIRNPANGYYYERVQTFHFKHIAERVTSECQFRQTTGRFPAKALDPEFMKLAFPSVTSYWHQESDEQYLLSVTGGEPGIIVEYAIETAEQEVVTE